MIIKSMSRKEPTYGKLIAYLSRDASDPRYELRHNVLSATPAALTAEFEGNGLLLPKRKNGVAMYHEIISITRPKGLSPEAQKAILRDIALDYIRERAPHCLAFGCLHDDHADHLHYHFIVSANRIGDNRRHRLTKQQFRAIQVGLEARVRARYPELEQAIAIGKRAGKNQLSQAGIELQRRTGGTPKRDTVKARLSDIFAASQSKVDLHKRLAEARLELYSRGKILGVRDLDSGRKHRIATLGLDAELNALGARLSLQSQPQQKSQDTAMNFFEAALQGLSAIIDVVSITTDTGRKLDDAQVKTRDAVRRTVGQPHTHGQRPTQTPPAPLSEAERIAAERLAEMNELRDEQDDQNSRQSSNQSTR